MGDVLVVPIEIVRVQGRSMLPTYAVGDLLVVSPVGRRRAGVAVVVDLPPDRDGRPRPLAVKRLLRRDPDLPGHWWIDSDNAGEGLTSFDVGPLPDSAIKAVVLARLPRRWRSRIERWAGSTST